MGSSFVVVGRTAVAFRDADARASASPGVGPRGAKVLARKHGRRQERRTSVERSHLLSYIKHVRFAWDPRKAASNLRKHGVSFEEASTAFQDELGAYYPDTLHENRFILIGYSRRQRLLYIVHAEVRRDAIRIISARKATKHEKARYENS
jgi:hypothetical protein